ncbi:MAG TPA: hypothetical protein VHX86_07190 [Tepidisphaeraceae bacterium]|jgi:hypothetical protein|nr:hypothetical protein [Tepidisphaeraceae bacterium]
MDPIASPSLDRPTLRSHARGRTYALRTIIWLAIAAIFWFSFVEGLHLRRWVFDAADPIRFLDDMRRGTYWGLQASGPEGYLNQYEKMDPEVPEWQDDRWTPWLDYSPLRLLVMRQWGAWQRAHHPPDPNVPLMDAWQRPYWFTAPVLRFNTVLEVFSAIFAFLLTRYWVLRGTVGESHGHFHGIWQGAVAALLIWFSPDLIINAHAWPQWDTWIVPWYLCGCLLASLDWWFAAGVAIAIGANFKGQMFSIMPIFIIWPLVQGRVGPALRWICGVVFCFAVITSGWLITYLPPDRLAAARSIQANLAVTDYPPNLFVIPRTFDLPAAVWIAEMLLVAATVPWLLRVLVPDPLTTPAARWRVVLHSRWTWIAAGTLLIVAAVWWPWLIPKNRSSWYVGLLAGAIVAAAALLLRRRSQGYVLAAIAGGGLLGCIWLFHGSACWWDCAVHYGSIHWPYMFIGPTSNVPAVFELRFGWEKSIDQIAFTLPALHGHWPGIISRRSWWPAFDLDVTAKMVFDTIYVVLLIVSGIAIGLQARRNDRRVLVAFVTPWIMFFLFPVQIQERYLLYAAGTAACCIGNSVGTALLGLLLTAFSVMMPMKILVDIPSSNLDRFGQNLSQAMPLIFSPDAGHTIQTYLDGTQPDIAWGILVVGLIFLYLSLTPSRRTTLN